MQHDGSSTTKSTRQRHREHTTTRQRATLAGIEGKNGCGWIVPQQQEQGYYTARRPHQQELLFSLVGEEPLLGECL
jgi:hypothetical protein